MAIDVVIYHNPECGTSRNVLGLIRNAGIEPHVVEYLKTPPARALLVALIDRASMTARKRPVRIVSASGNQLLVRGLRPGETIVTAGVHLLREGEKVRIAEVPKA